MTSSIERSPDDLLVGVLRVDPVGVPSLGLEFAGGTSGCHSRDKVSLGIEPLIIPLLVQCHVAGLFVVWGIALDVLQEIPFPKI